MIKLLVLLVGLTLARDCLCQSSIQELAKTLDETIEATYAEERRYWNLQGDHEFLRIKCEKEMSKLTYKKLDENRELDYKLWDLKRLQISILEIKLKVKSLEQEKAHTQQQQEKVDAAQKFMDRHKPGDKWKEALIPQCKEMKKELASFDHFDYKYLGRRKSQLDSFIKPRSMSKLSPFGGLNEEQLLLDKIREEKEELRKAEGRRKLQESLNKELENECTRRSDLLENEMKELVSDVRKTEATVKKYSEEERVLKRKRLDLLILVTNLEVDVEEAIRKIVAYCQDVGVL